MPADLAAKFMFIQNLAQGARGNLQKAGGFFKGVGVSGHLFNLKSDYSFISVISSTPS